MSEFFSNYNANNFEVIKFQWKGHSLYVGDFLSHDNDWGNKDADNCKWSSYDYAPDAPGDAEQPGSICEKIMSIYPTRADLIYAVTVGKHEGKLYFFKNGELYRGGNLPNKVTLKSQVPEDRVENLLLKDSTSYIHREDIAELTLKDIVRIFESVGVYWQSATYKEGMWQVDYMREAAYSGYSCRFDDYETLCDILHTELRLKRFNFQNTDRLIFPCEKDHISNDVTCDTGNLKSFEGGGHKEISPGKGRFDLIPPEMLKRLAIHLGIGAEKYGDDNWRKGLPEYALISSAMRHINQYRLGETDEDHLAAAICNITFLMVLKETGRLL